MTSGLVCCCILTSLISSFRSALLAARCRVLRVPFSSRFCHWGIAVVSTICRTHSHTIEYASSKALPCVLNLQSVSTHIDQMANLRRESLRLINGGPSHFHSPGEGVHFSSQGLANFPGLGEEERANTIQERQPPKGAGVEILSITQEKEPRNFQ